MNRSMNIVRNKTVRQGQQHARYFCAAAKMAIRQPIPMKVPSAAGHSPAVSSFQPPASIHEKLLASYQKHVFAEQEQGSRNWRAACLANLHKKDYHKARRYWVRLREKERVSKKFFLLVITYLFLPPESLSTAQTKVVKLFQDTVAKQLRAVPNSALPNRAVKVLNLTLQEETVL